MATHTKTEEITIIPFVDRTVECKMIIDFGFFFV